MNRARHGELALEHLTDDDLAGLLELARLDVDVHGVQPPELKYLMVEAGRRQLPDVGR